MSRSRGVFLPRRGFLKGAAAGAATLVAPVCSSDAQTPNSQAQAPADHLLNQQRNGRAAVPGEAVLARESGTVAPAAVTEFIEHPGSDFMVDVIKSLDIEYLASNPGSTFESLHESLINYGGNTKPEFLTVMHEETAIAMAQGYYKVERKPMMALLHGDIGLQHASMAIYNAYADRVPVFMVVGNHADAVPLRGMKRPDDLPCNRELREVR